MSRCEFLSVIEGGTWQLGYRRRRRGWQKGVADNGISVNRLENEIIQSRDKGQKLRLLLTRIARYL